MSKQGIDFETWFDDHEDELRIEFFKKTNGNDKDWNGNTFEDWAWQEFCHIGPEDDARD